MLRGAGVPWCWLRGRGPPRPTTRAGRHARWCGEYLLEDLTALLLAMIDDGADQFGDDARGIQVAVPDRVVDQAIADSIGDGSIGDDLEPASHGQSGSEHGGTAPDTIFQDLQQGEPGRAIKMLDTRIVKDDHIGSGDLVDLSRAYLPFRPRNRW